MSFSIGPIGAAFINFLTVPITTWLISPQEYGKTSIFLLLQTLATSVVFLGMDHSYMREFNNNKNGRNLLFNCFIFPFTLALLLSLILFIGSDFFSIIIFGENHKLVIILFAIWLPFMTIERFLLLNIRMHEKGFIFSIFNILIKLFILILTIFFLLGISRNFSMVIAATVLGQILVDLILIVYTVKINDFKSFGKFSLFLSKPLIIKLFKFGIPFVPTAFLMWFLNSIDRIILEKYSSLHELGIYFAAIKIIGIITIFRDVFVNFYLPVAYRWKEENVSVAIFDQVSKVVTVSMTIIFIIIMFSKELIVILLSSNYSEVIILLPFLVIYPIMFTWGEATGLGISFARKTHYNVIISIILAVINFILNILLIQKYNAIGASISIGITYIIYFWLRTLISRKLWFKFNLKFYFIHTIILILIATGNIVIENTYIYLFNFIMLIIVIIYDRKLIKLIKKRR